MVDADSPVPVTGLRGKVTRRVFGKGTKSEHLAVWIDTDRGSFVLRRKGGPAFDDPELDRYVGRTVACDGFLLSHTLLAERIAVEP
ncbi:MAG TPA: hypothetical protein VML91_23585 [Burkholderiales bacterium]|nr:hypothetical protein [Burkholderiales bacterium]